MKRRRLFLIPLGCVAAIALAVLLWPREREPEYNGIALSDWLERTGRLPRTRSPKPKPGYSFIQVKGTQFETAIRHMGTNALPGLLRAVQFQTPPWRHWLYCRLVPKLSAKMANGRTMWWLFGIKGYDRSAGAIAAFGVLGDDARPALDDLRRIAGRYDGSGTFASLAIREMGYGSRDVDPSRIQF